MLASEKEKKCIDIAAPLIREHALNRIKETKIDYSPVFDLQSYRKLVELEKAFILDNKKVFGSILYLLVVILLYPLAFISQLIYALFFLSDEDKRKKSENKILKKDILDKHYPDYQVSEKKSFFQLWSDKGLRDYGHTHMDEGPYSYEEKFYCLSEWIKILYDEDFDLKKLEDEIRERERKKIREYYKKHPNNHINPASIIDLIPFSVDALFGEYYESREFSNN